MYRIVIIGMLGFLISQTAYTQNNNSKDFKFPEYQSHVNDFEGIYDAAQIAELNELIIAHKKKTSNEICVVTIKSYKPYKSLDDYSKGLAEDWQIGKEDKSNGIVIVFGRKIRKIKIEVGAGLSDKLTEEEAEDIISDHIIPEFRKRDIHQGIKNGVIEIIKELED